MYRFFPGFLLFVCLFTGAHASELRVPGANGNTAIAPPEEALTFARFVRAGIHRTLLVTGASGGQLQGIDLGGTDPVDAFNREGYEKLSMLASTGAGRSPITVHESDLVIPVQLADSHVAAGANFPEHAEDATVEEGPFLFAKLVRPTAWNAAVPHPGGLLDFEVELAWVTLKPIGKEAAPDYLGLLLCNDFTDRATLLRNLDPWDIESGKGFTTGKSFPGFLPVGNLFVIPRDFRAFAGKTRLQLFRENEKRQDSVVRQAVWEIDELLAQAWAWSGVTWEHREQKVRLPSASGQIPARTLILSGTPSGTVFDGISMSQKIRGLFRWLSGGWNQPLAANVIEVYIEDATHERTFLQPGEKVLAIGTHLGRIESVIE